MDRKVIVIGWCLLIGMVFSCKKTPDHLKEALRFAGNNRPELEKVLQHYASPKDSLKYKAAVFLIENMPRHYSYTEPNELTRYYDEIDTVYEKYKDLALDDMINVYEKISSKYDLSKMAGISDAKCVTADYLIDNIDQAFDVWKNGSWATHVNFDDFCEYILPYKCAEGQTLDNWREYLKDAYNANLATLHECSLFKNLAFRACENVNQELKNQLKSNIVVRKKIIPVYRLRTSLKKPLGTCDDYAFIATSVLRAKGIPVAMDNTPQWAFRSMGHSWNVLLDNFGKNIVFLGCDSPLGIPHKEDHPTAKVFRNSFAINRDIEKLYYAEKYIPYAFRDICVKDVTSEYINNALDIEVIFKEKTKNKYAYLAVFDNKNWTPIQFGKISGNKAVFAKMGRHIAYLPVSYSQNGVVPLANPFILTYSGEKKEIIPDLNNRQQMTLYRKYHLIPDGLFFHNRIAGAKIQASDYADFRNAETIYTIQQSEITTGEIILTEQNKSYRYWRFYEVDNAYCSLAELYFYEKDNHNATYGKIIGSEGSYSDIGDVKEFVFDKDPLTFYNAKNPSGDWVGMDFGKPVNIEKIYYIPRGDGNSIVIGDEYELMYWDNNKWNSLGRKTADRTYISFDNCPLNALFLLHDLTTGIEERIFIYEKGKQIFW